MVVVMEPGASTEQIDRVISEVREMGFKSHPIYGEEMTVIGVIGTRTAAAMERLAALSGVERVVPIEHPYKLTSREGRGRPSSFHVGGVHIGGSELVVIAGPCAVEGEEQFLSTARHVKQAGAQMLRGGIFKPRTSPYSFRGLGGKGLPLLAEARAETGLPVVSEVLDPRHVELMADYVDVYQIGTRNMQNFILLDEVGQAGKPVLLKRGFSATLHEMLLAAEYIASQGNDRIILCERGIRCFETSARYTLDLSAVPILKRETHLPIAVDPSHAAGKRWLVPPLACAAVAVGADVLMVEVHPRPAEAQSDGAQALTFGDFDRLMAQIANVPRYKYL
ncbi:MAG TPA: 3-deoxy-7-phosphoheptulonate synthase [Armatimonadetes bacterium]|nr:3-deoxy-7-phosphoheptulonate synthase [Armatimonadota bacterium]